jgi:hypothetical protein
MSVSSWGAPSAKRTRSVALEAGVIELELEPQASRRKTTTQIAASAHRRLILNS